VARARARVRMGWHHETPSWLEPRTGGGWARRGARGLSQPLSQCKHVLIEIRSSGYNSFADVAAQPPLSFSLLFILRTAPCPNEPSRHPFGPCSRFWPFSLTPVPRDRDFLAPLLAVSITRLSFRDEQRSRDILSVSEFGEECWRHFWELFMMSRNADN